MKYRIIKLDNFGSEMFQIQRFIQDGVQRWQHVPNSTCSTVAEVERNLAYLSLHGQLKDEVIKEVEI